MNDAAVRELIHKTCAKAGTPCTVPIIINGRLTATLGRVHYINSCGTEHVNKIEIARKLVESASDDDCRDIILHECAHYIAFVRTGVRHGHDAYFKRVCAELGTNDDKCATNVNWVKPDSEVYKYNIYCSKCGELICNRNRTVYWMKTPDAALSTCCEAPIRVVQNW